MVEIHLYGTLENETSAWRGSVSFFNEKILSPLNRRPVPYMDTYSNRKEVCLWLWRPSENKCGNISTASASCGNRTPIIQTTTLVPETC